MNEPLFLVWFDESKLPLAEKLRAAHAAFLARFGYAALVAYVSEGADVEGAIGHRYVRPNNIWVGMEEMR